MKNNRSNIYVLSGAFLARLRWLFWFLNRTRPLESACRYFKQTGFVAGCVCLVNYTSFGLSPVFAAAKMPIARIAGKHVVQLEVASSEAEIERGLMYRTYLPEESGMVFLFNPPRAVQFWMYHTLIPLDMCFIRHGQIVKIFHNVPPCRSPHPDDCQRYPEGTGLLVSEVIELNGGYATRHGIKEGDTVSFELPQP